MLHQYSRKKKKQLDFYFRCLSSICLNGLLADYYVVYEFHKTERLLRSQVMKSALHYWNIKDTHSFKNRIHWLLEDGCQHEYNQIHAPLATLTNNARQKYMEVSTNDANDGRIAVVHQFLPQLPEGNITAFGVAWAILLNRIGPIYGYITKEEAWKAKIDIAQHIQDQYKNWENYLTAFAAGSAFIQADPEMKNNRDIINMIVSLLHHTTLVYKDAVWQQNLSPDKGASANNQGTMSR